MWKSQDQTQYPGAVRQRHSQLRYNLWYIYFNSCVSILAVLLIVIQMDSHFELIKVGE